MALKIKNGRQSVTTTLGCQGVLVNQIAPHIPGVGNTPDVLELGGVRMSVNQSTPLKKRVEPREQTEQREQQLQERRNGQNRNRQLLVA